MSAGERYAELEPFISSELRPRVVPMLDVLEPHNPTLSVDEIRMRALEILGLTEEMWLMKNPEIDASELWAARLSRNPDVTWNTLDSETVLLNVESSKYYTLNRSATVIWELLGENLTLSEILDKLCENFDTSSDVAKPDVLSLALQLRSENLVSI